MKIDPRRIRFMTPFLPTRKRRFDFVGRSNTVHVLETSMLIEGNLKLLGFPFVDLLFRQALGEWTTITIPYSRIDSYKYHRMRFRRSAAALMIWSPVALGVSMIATGKDGWIIALIAALLSPIALLMHVYLSYRVLRSRNRVVFRQANGRSAVVIFHITASKVQERFSELLRRNLRESAEATSATVTAGG